MDITGGTVNGNTAAAEGGGVWNGSGIMNIMTVTIDGNTANGSGADQGGGGVFNNGGTINISYSTISNNNATAAPGGGIQNTAGGTTNTDYTTVSGNTTATTGGGVNNDDGAININATTIAFNTATGDGGGIFNNSNTITITSTIVSNNTNEDVFGANYSSNGFNLIGIIAGTFPTQPTDLIAADPGLFPLADNGGATQTHELLCASPATDVGNPADANAAQNEVVVNGVRDIGAFESPENCNNGNVPTLSQWGLIILALLILTTGVLGMMREKELVPSLIR